jgi:hypothetical protein
MESGMHVADWLQQIGLGQYARLFVEHDISSDVLPHLTAEDLIALGINVVGHRRRLLVAIAGLRGAASPDTNVQPAIAPVRTNQVWQLNDAT